MRLECGRVGGEVADRGKSHENQKGCDEFAHRE